MASSVREVVTLVIVGVLIGVVVMGALPPVEARSVVQVPALLDG